MTFRYAVGELEVTERIRPVELTVEEGASTEPGARLGVYTHWSTARAANSVVRWARVKRNTRRAHRAPPDDRRPSMHSHSM